MKKLVYLILLQMLCHQYQPMLSKHSETLQRANRLLQASANATYVFPVHPQVKEFCDDQGIKQTDIDITEEKRKELRVGIEGRDKAVIEIGEEQVNGGSTDVGKAFGKIFAGRLGVALIFAALSLLSLAWISVWVLTECCCKKTCCVGEEKEGTDRTFAKKVCWCTTLVVGILSIIMAIIWVSFLGVVVSRTKDIRCGLAILNNDLINGVYVDETKNNKFLGTEGIQDLLDTFKGMFDEILSVKTDAQTVVGVGLDTKSTALGTAYDTYNTNYENDKSTYTYKGAFDGTSNVLPVYVTVLSEINGKPLKTEVDTLKSAALSIHNAAVSISGFDSTSIASSKAEIDKFKGQLKTNLRNNLDKMYKYIGGSNDNLGRNGSNSSSSDSEKTDYSKTLSGYSNAFIAVVSVFVICMTLVFLIILLLNIKGKCMCLKCLNKVIMLIQLFLGILILIFCIIGAVFSVAFSVMCYLTDKFQVDKDYISVNLGKFSQDNPQVTNILQSCVYVLGDGDILKALGADPATFNDLTSITDGMIGFQNLKSNLSDQTEPFVGGITNGNITGYKDGTIEDKGFPEDQGLVKGYTTFNNYSCSGDYMRISGACMGSDTVSSTGDTFSASFGSPYCIKFGLIPNHNYVGRYSSNVCQGSSSNKNAELTNTVAAMTQFKTHFTTIDSKFTTFYTSEKDVFTAMKGSITELNRILEKVNASIKTLQDLQGSFKKVIDCRIMNKEVRLFENVVCYRVSTVFYSQVGLGVTLGVILFFYSWCMCCSIRCANAKEEDKEKKAQYEDNAPNQAVTNGEHKNVDYT